MRFLNRPKLPKVESGVTVHEFMAFIGLAAVTIGRAISI